MSQNKPVKTFSAGHVRAGIWRNKERRDGHTILRFSVRVQKQKDREYQDADCYYEDDLADLELVTRKAHEFIRLRESEARKKIGSLLEDAHSGVPEGDQARKSSRIQKLIDELRATIVASDELKPGHKRRMLNRLERLQSELHKETSDLPHLLRILVKMSTVAREIGGSLKPIVGWTREIVKIAVLTQVLNFALPSDTPFRVPGQIGSPALAPVAGEEPPTEVGLCTRANLGKGNPYHAGGRKATNSPSTAASAVTLWTGKEPEFTSESIHRFPNRPQFKGVILTQSHQDHEVRSPWIRSFLCGFVPSCELILVPAEGRAGEIGMIAAQPALSEVERARTCLICGSKGFYLSESSLLAKIPDAI